MESNFDFDLTDVKFDLEDKGELLQVEPDNLTLKMAENQWNSIRCTKQFCKNQGGAKFAYEFKTLEENESNNVIAGVARSGMNYAAKVSGKA